MTEKEYQVEVARIIDNHSGGMKFTELIVELSMSKGKYFTPDPDKVEAAIRADHELDILEYEMRLSETAGRLKMFVHRPLRNVSESATKQTLILQLLDHMTPDRLDDILAYLNESNPEIVNG